jgi:hypothetical protein
MSEGMYNLHIAPMSEYTVYAPRVHCIKLILYSNVIKLESAILFQRMKFHKFIFSEKGNFHKVPCLHTQYRAGIFKQSMGARNRVGIGLSYRPARLHRLAELFLGIIS